MSLKKTRKRSIGGLIAAAILAASCQLANAQELPGRTTVSGNLAVARAAYEALPESDRKALQDALIWTGAYSGIADGVFGRQTFEALAAFQQVRRKSPTGILSPAERADLLATAQRAKVAAGFMIVDDARTGARIGIPTRLLTKSNTNASGGGRWQSADDRVTLDTRTAPPSATLASLYDRNVASQVAGRLVTYKVLRPDFFVVAGETATGKFYTRYDAGESGLRGFSIGYDKTFAPQFDSLMVAIANSFDPFPAASAPAVAATPEPPSPRPETANPGGRRLIGTGIVVGPRRVITTAPVNSCRDLNVGDMQVVSAQPSPNNARWTTIELPRGLPATVGQLEIAAGTADASIIIVGFITEGERSVLSVMPGVMSADRSVTAPLQSGESGAPVLDDRNRLVGIVAPVDGNGTKVAGVMTSGRHVIVPSVDLRATLPVSSGEPKSQLHGTADIAGFWKPVLVPLTCAP